MSCRDKISSTCNKKVNAKCVDYEGEYHQNSDLEVCDKPSMEDVIEDINETLDEITDSINLSLLEESCIEYEQAGDRLLVREALDAHAAKICELIEHTGLGEPESCPDCNDPCGNQTEATCCTGLVYYASGTGETFVSTISHLDWGVINTAGYEDLVFTVTRAGTYKITVDMGCVEEDVNGRAYIGISKNGANPLNLPFVQREIIPIPVYTEKAYHFILESLIATDVISIRFKGNVVGSISIDGVRMIVEKVG